MNEESVTLVHFGAHSVAIILVPQQLSHYSS